MLVFQGPSEPVQCLAFVPGPDGGWLAAGHRGTLVLWPLAGGDRVELPLAPADQVQGTHGLEEITVSPDGKWIAGRWYRGVRLWRNDPGGWINVRVRAVTGMSGVAIRDSDLVLLGGGRTETGEWVVYELSPIRLPPKRSFVARRSTRTEPHPAALATRGVGIIRLSPDGRLLATAAREKAVQLWDATTGKHLGPLPQRGFVEALAWSPDGGTLALNAGVTTRLYDVATRTERVAWKVKYCYLPRLAFSPDGRLVATTDNGTGVHLWDVATGVRRTTLRAGRERRVPLAFAPDGLTVAAGGANGSVAIWDL